MSHRDYRIPLSAIDHPFELGPAWHAQLAAGSAALRRLPRATLASLPPPAQRALQAQLRAARATAQDVLDGTEEGYLLTRGADEAAALQQEAQRGQQKAHHQRLTFIGSDTAPRTHSHLGWINDDPRQPLALARDRGSVILVSGTPGSGKTVLSTLVGEGSFHRGGLLASETLLPTAYAFFHLEENDRLPQLLDGLKPNPTPHDLALLAERLGVSGQGLQRLRLVLPHWLITDELMLRLRPYQDLGLDVAELRVHLGEIGQPGLEAALGADDGTRLAQRLLDDAQNQGQRLSAEGMRTFIKGADDLDAGAKRKALIRVDLLAEIEAKEPGQPGIWGLFAPGWATVVYLGGPHMGRGRVTPLLVSLLSGLMVHSDAHGAFQRVIAVDEINLLDKDERAWRMFVKAARLARHRGWTLILMGQDLLCVPDEMFGVTGVLAVFRQSSPQVFEHQRQRMGALRSFRWDDAAELLPGEALLAVMLSSSGQRALRVRLRPPLCMHGGFTRGAI